VPGFLLVLALANLHMIGLADPWAWTFLPNEFAVGEWWRLFTHPFVHISAYHLVLDGAAFLLLYTSLREPRRWKRLSLVAWSAAGALIVALIASPLIQDAGLCGLSGIAHGLTAVMALEMILGPNDPLVRRAGWACFALVVVKCAFEAITGNVVFDSWHLGSVGQPVAICHTGGVLGGLLGWLAMNPGASEARSPAVAR